MADVEDQWLKQALKNDNLVAQLLFRLKRSSPLANPPALRWGRRGRRSNPHPVPAVVRKKEIIEKARCSPSTPLSWSGGSDSNESRRRRLLKAKSAFASESPMATTSKKSTKKPSFGELKDKQIQLLKEKVHLKKNIASLHVTMKEQKARKEKLNKLKLRVKIPPADKSEKTPSELVAPLSNRGNQTKSSPIGQALPISQKHAMGDNGIAPSSSSLEQMDVNPRESCFDIPDLNTMPLENEQVPKALITQRS